MAISTGDAILKYANSWVLASSGTPAQIGNNAFVIADQGGTALWTNTEDVRYAAAVLECTFAIAATAGNIELHALLKAVDGTNDSPTPSADYLGGYVAAFQPEYNTNAIRRLVIAELQLPSPNSSQRIDWYVRNNGTGQNINSGWALRFKLHTDGAKA